MSLEYTVWYLALQNGARKVPRTVAFLILQKWSQQIPEDIRIEVQVYWRGGINDIYSVHSGFANICKKQLT